MNYLGHARDCLDRPYELLGTVLPDWIRLLDRRSRIRPWMLNGAVRFRGEGPRAEIERGLRRHFADDAWFHSTPAFHRVTGEIAAMIREVYPDRPERRLRASFYAHLMAEMLLDAWLLEVEPGRAADFARAVQGLDHEVVIGFVEDIAPRPVEGLSGLIYRFGDATLLRRYADDAVVVQRLNRMGRLVDQADLPLEFPALVAPARELVRRNGDALLTRP